MKLFVFDLDFTLWDAGGTWCDATQPPYQWENECLYDRAGRHIHLYSDVIDILEKLQQRGKWIAAASRTSEPSWALNLLQLFGIDGFFDQKEIYPGSKLQHFNAIQKRFDVSFSEMVFFDDEYRNIQEVSQLGVTSVFVKNGITTDMVDRYL